jgi:hypothetical protein
MATSSHTDAYAFVAELVKGKLARLCDGINRNGSSYFEVPCGLVFYLVVSEETRVEGQNALRPRLFVDTGVDSERAGPFGSVGETNEVLKADRAHHIAHKHGWLSYEDDCLVAKTPAFDTFIRPPCAQSDVTAGRRACSPCLMRRARSLSAPAASGSPLEARRRAQAVVQPPSRGSRRLGRAPCATNRPCSAPPAAASSLCMRRVPARRSVPGSTHRARCVGRERGARCDGYTRMPRASYKENKNVWMLRVWRHLWNLEALLNYKGEVIA